MTKNTWLPLVFVSSFFAFSASAQTQSVRGDMVFSSGHVPNARGLIDVHSAVGVGALDAGLSANSPALNQCVAVASLVPYPIPLVHVAFSGKGYKTQFFSDNNCVNLVETMDVPATPEVEMPNIGDDAFPVYVEPESPTLTFPTPPQSFMVLAL